MHSLRGGIEVRAIRRQLDEVDAAVWSGKESPDIWPFVIGGVVPDDMNDALFGVAGLNLGKNRAALIPSTVVGSTKGASQVSRLSAPWIFTRPRPAVVGTPGFEPVLTQPKAGFV